MNWRNKISFAILGIFSIFGAFFIGVTLHEYYHYYDFKKYHPVKDELCAVALPTSLNNMSKAYAGYYQFQVGYNETAPSEERLAKSESIAYIITFIIGIIWLCAYMNVQTDRIDRGVNEKYSNLLKDIMKPKEVPDELPLLPSSDNVQNNINNIYKAENSSKSEYSP